MKLNEAFATFPRNDSDFYGAIVLFSKKCNSLIRMEFGSGDNLSVEDIAEGYDDYINLDMYQLDGTLSFPEVVDSLNESGGYLDSTEGLEEVDGGMLIVKHEDYDGSGDIRSYIVDSLAHLDYKVPEGEDEVEFLKNDLVFVGLYD